MHATTDCRLLCRPISSIPAVRQLSAGKSAGPSDSSPGSPQGEEGGRWSTSRATVARGERAGCAEQRTGESTYARGRKCENALALRGKRAPAEFPGQAIARESTLDKRRRRYGRAGVHTENAWKQTRRPRFGVAGGRRVSAHVQPARNFQGVSSAPGSAQHEQSVQDVSFASGRERRACEKEEREKERASESENERREDSRESAREARE